MKQRLAGAMLLVLAGSVFAETVYIRDTLYVPLRGGQSFEHRILHQGIKSGTPLERLEVNEETGFTLVRTPGGMEGWIQNQYLVLEPIARDKLETLQAELNATNRKLASLSETLARAENMNQEAEARLVPLTEENQLLINELARITELAANVIEINQINEQLQVENQALDQQIDDLAIANTKLKDNRNQDWFLRGAGVVLLGLLFGFWVARSVYHKRGTGWS